MQTIDHTVFAYVAIGSNVGDSQAIVQQAMRDIGALPHTVLLEQSSIWKTAPWQTQGPDFLNAVVRVQTSLAPQELMSALLNLENKAGRTRPYRYAPRTLDLDLIFYGNWVIKTPSLEVPHPRWHERDFVKGPLSELTAPDAL